MQSCWVQSLQLHYFRNYTSLTLKTSKDPVVLTGPNGAGKTNILEALSFLSPGRGLRKDKLANVGTFGAYEGWVVTTVLHSQGAEKTIIGTGLERLATGQLSEKRTIRIDQQPIPQSELLERVHVIWQTPQMDRLFIDGMSERRKFLDKLIAGLDPSHNTRLYRYEYALRERSKLLRENIRDQAWLKALEEKMASESVAICASRQDFVTELNTFCQQRVSHFPRAKLTVEGQIETWLQQHPAVEVEALLLQKFYDQRSHDAFHGGATHGAHHSHLEIWHAEMGHLAEICSTGEQKALLLSIMLADCRLQFAMQKRAPLLLLDEVLAHLDAQRRESLFAEINGLQVQAWMTGTDRHIFEPIQQSAQFFTVAEGKVT